MESDAELKKRMIESLQGIATQAPQKCIVEIMTSDFPNVEYEATENMVDHSAIIKVKNIDPEIVKQVMRYKIPAVYYVDVVKY